MSPIKIVDLFAGAGGLGEGFSAFQVDNIHPYQIVLSAEKEKYACETLKYRTYWRLLKNRGLSTRNLYSYYKGKTRTIWTGESEYLWNIARHTVKNIELGKEKDNNEFFSCLQKQIGSENNWLLIGGPPCQAYSLIGRARSGENNLSDPRRFLYEQYVNILGRFKPAVFVMENVRGLLSYKIDDTHILNNILNDLTLPCAGTRYRICSLVADTCYEHGMNPDSIDMRSFMVQCEKYGIPQKRHRLVLVGIREDIRGKLGRLEPRQPVTLQDAIGDMPKLRSGISKVGDSWEHWKQAVESACARLANVLESQGDHKMSQYLQHVHALLQQNRLDRGSRWIEGSYPSCTKGDSLSELQEWLTDPSLDGWLQHETRMHMAADLQRYLYASSYAKVYLKNDFGLKNCNLEQLVPNHASWEEGIFADRFRVQLSDKPSSTITSHMSKDGHAYIHPDPEQCRSLTVREAARLQTFPDNYYFCGTRTEQYIQIGNAVPPFLSYQIAKCIYNILNIR